MPPASPQTSKRSLRPAVLPWAAVVAWAAIIYYFSSKPSLSTGWGVWDYVLRKTAHFFEFAVLTLLVWRAIRSHGAGHTLALRAGGLISLLYALSDELHQRFVPGRYGAFRDIGFDLAGIIAAMAVAEYAFRKRRRIAENRRAAG